MYKGRHSAQEIKIIKQYAHDNKELTIEQIATFIYNRFGCRWNTRDKHTREYLNDIVNGVDIK
jgi:hypothetical protein